MLVRNHPLDVNEISQYSAVVCVLRVCSESYHGQHSLGLLEERFRQQGDVDTLGDGHRAAVQVCDDHVQLKTHTHIHTLFISAFVFQSL